MSEMRVSVASITLAVFDQTEDERFVMRNAQPGDSVPDQKSTWIYATLEKSYRDDQTVFADCWMTWDCWLLIGNDGVKASLREETKKARRRQLRQGVERIPHKRAVTFVLR